MRKKYMIIPALVIATAMNLTACSLASNQQNSTEIKENEIMDNDTQEAIEVNKAVYTNLADETTQEGIEESLIEAGIEEETAKEFIQWVKDYNASVVSELLPVLGYRELGADPIDYSQFMVEEEYREDGSYVSGMNCRLTAYLLMQQFLTTKQKFTEYDPYLMFDIECIEMDERFKNFDEETFITLMEPVEVKEDTTLEEHIDAILSAWEERGINLQGNDNVSLITMYLHDINENKRFVGHAGVMLTTEDGLILVEKYGWNEPFQVTKFENEQEMVDYLLNRPDLVGDSEELPVIVMKDNTVIS